MAQEPQLVWLHQVMVGLYQSGILVKRFCAKHNKLAISQMRRTKDPGEVKHFPEYSRGYLVIDVTFTYLLKHPVALVIFLW